MSRYIDADKLKQHYSWWSEDDRKDFDDVVDSQPTADVVKVVRCQECKHFTYCENDCCFPQNYCSQGERSERPNYFQQVFGDALADLEKLTIVKGEKK